MTHQSFRVRAHLVNGLNIDPRFGIGLDSLLASSIRERTKRELNISGEELDGGLNRFIAPAVKTVALPLSICNSGKEWHWMSTCAIPLDSAGNVISVHNIDVRSYIQIEDHKELEHSVGKLPANISSSSGRWKMSRGVKPVTLGRYLTWTGHGNLKTVRDLLSDIHSVGAGRRTGLGTVIKWEVEPTETTMHDAGHLGIDNKPARPVFEVCLRHVSVPIDINSMENMRAGFRPPYWHLGHQEEVLIYPRK